MTVQDLYDVISDISTQDVKLYFVTRKTKENITKKMRAKDKFEYIKLIVMMNCERQFCQHRRNNLRLLLTRILIW